MKCSIKKIALFIALTICLFELHAAEKLLLAGCNWNKIMIVDKKTGQKNWIYEIPNYRECNSADITPEKNIFFANKIGAALVSPKKEIIWEYKVENGEELHTAFRLQNGNFIVGICGTPARFVELSKSGKVLKETKYDTGIENVHAQFRRISKNKKGNYIVALWGKKKIVEISPSGKVLDEIALKNPSFAIIQLKNGNYLVSGGDSHLVEEVNPKTKEIVRRIDNSNLQGDAKILFAATAEELANGDILLANWNGHSKEKSQPKVLQIDKNNKIVWTFSGDSEIANVSSLKTIK